MVKCNNTKCDNPAVEGKKVGVCPKCGYCMVPVRLVNGEFEKIETTFDVPPKKETKKAKTSDESYIGEE